MWERTRTHRQALAYRVSLDLIGIDWMGRDAWNPNCAFSGLTQPRGKSSNLRPIKLETWIKLPPLWAGIPEGLHHRSKDSSAALKKTSRLELGLRWSQTATSPRELQKQIKIFPKGRQQHLRPKRILSHT